MSLLDTVLWSVMRTGSRWTYAVIRGMKEVRQNICVNDRDAGVSVKIQSRHSEDGFKATEFRW